MRISSGVYKGRQIRMPKLIRPTQDKVRKAVFDILGDIEGWSFLELFSGSGAIGLEAASRGAGEVVMVERNRDCLLAIRKNIVSLDAKGCSIYPLEAEKAIRVFFKQGKKFDIVFLDPPYYLDMAKKTLQTLGGYDILTPRGFIIAQHFKKDNLPQAEGKLFVFKQATYGDTMLSFYQKGP